MRTVYAGVPLTYRDDGPAHDFLGEVTSAFDKVYLFGEFSYLFLAGQWKRGTELVFVAPVLSPDQNIAMQGVEHSLSKIVTTQKGLTELAATGIPAHKLETRAQHIAALAGKRGRGVASMALTVSRSALEPAHTIRRASSCASIRSTVCSPRR